MQGSLCIEQFRLVVTSAWVLHQPFLRELTQLWSRLSPHTKSESRWLVRVPEGILSGSQLVSTVCEQGHRCPVVQDTADARHGDCWVVSTVADRMELSSLPCNSLPRIVPPVLFHMELIFVCFYVVTLEQISWR